MWPCSKSLSCTNDDLASVLSVSLLTIPACNAFVEASNTGNGANTNISERTTATVTVSLNDLLAEMVDLERLTRIPDQSFSVHLASSYDRSSVTPVDSSDTPTAWYANNDFGNFVSVYEHAGRVEHVMLDIDGPGALMRIWSANMGGTLRIYVDGSNAPSIELDFTQLLEGQIPPYLAPFAGANAIAGNFDFPIPYQTHVKVTMEGGVGTYSACYYQVEYRTYHKGSVNLESFDASKVDPDIFDQVRTLLLDPVIPESDETVEEVTLDADNPAFTIAASPGGEAIREFEMSFSSQDAATLRTSKLILNFDGRETVKTPLGDFFGAGPGLVSHATLPVEVRSDGTAISRFVMPFASSAAIVLEPTNSLSVALRVIHSPRPFDERSLYFGAHWVARGPMGAAPYRDLKIAQLNGVGFYVGTSVSVGNASKRWWGEGDEKIWVDQDSFPSLFGTGTEDYFGIGFCSPQAFSHPYRAQSLSAGGFEAAQGLFSLARFHVFDAIPFNTQLNFNMELWHWDREAQLTYDTIAYFYLDAQGLDLLPSPSDEDFRLSPLFP